MCIYVRSIGIAEGRQLQRIVRKDANRIKVRRAQVVLASAQGSKVPDVARRLYFSEQHVRTILKDFNERGIDALLPHYGGGRPPKFSDEQISLIVEAALFPPDLLGWPFRRWSLAKLRDHLLREKVIESISLEKLRQLLRARKVRLQRTKTWKECNDPQLRSKKN